MSATNPHTTSKESSTSSTSVDTDGSGDVTVTVGELRHIDHVADVDVSVSGGYVGSVQSVSGNDVTVRIFESAGSNAEMAAVTSGSDVTDVYVRAKGY